MAFKRSWLSTMGIEADKIDEIMAEHVAVTEALKEQRDLAKADADKLKSVEEELEALKQEYAKYKADTEKYPEIKKELDELKSNGESKYTALKSEYEKYKADVAAKAEQSAKETAYKALLKECGVSDKRVDSVLKVTDLSKVMLGDDGKIQDADSLKSNIASEWADFIVTEQKKGAQTETPPENHGGKMTKEEILAIKDTAKRQRAIAENLEVFGY